MVRLNEEDKDILHEEDKNILRLINALLGSFEIRRQQGRHVVVLDRNIFQLEAILEAGGDPVRLRHLSSITCLVFLFFAQIRAAFWALLQRALWPG